MTFRAFIAGAASGIGRATAQELKSRGCELVLADLALQKIQPVAHVLDAQAMAIDISDHDGLAVAAASVEPLDAVIITAGLSPGMGDFARIIDVNLTGTAAAVDAFVPRIRPGGAVLCLASMTAHNAPISDPRITDLLDTPFRRDLADALTASVGEQNALPGMAYALSKAGILRLVQRLAGTLGKQGLRICSVSPGCIDTPMGALEMGRGETSRDALLHAPIPRSGTAEEVAKAIAFLVSPDASYITGCDLLVDGGWVGALRAGGSESPLAMALQKGREKG